MSPRKRHPATLKKVLVSYDGPQLAVLDDGSKYVIVATATDLPGRKFPLFCAAVLEKTFDVYMRGKVDLLFIYKATPKSRYYICELINDQNELDLVKLEGQYDLTDLYPVAGIFSNIHTHPYSVTPKGDVSKRFLIDGTWEARDFSRFYGRMADAYSLLYIVSNGSEGSLSQRSLDYLVAAIEEKPWKGGGSYLSFYKDLKEHAESHPLRVQSIEYHSPGHLVLAGKKEILEEMIGTVAGLIENYEPKRALYADLYKFMRRGGWLTREKTKVDRLGERVSSIIVRRSTSLAESLGLSNWQLILEACDNDALRYAKVIMSYFRRTRGLADFYVQGRVKNY